MEKMNNTPLITGGSVKVMRSYDYCHFEVCLSASDLTSPEEIDELRKTAARLADKAVTQYQIAKRNAELAMRDKSNLESIRYRHRDILEKPEGERTPEETAIVKAIEDRAHFNRPCYDYEDDFEPDFSDDDDEMF
jgi:hypothetical protein